MHCVFAFLLIPTISMHKETERLALVGADNHDAIYSVFEPKISGQFPFIGPEHDILSTNSRIGGPGTYVKAYCSNSLGIIKIIELLSNDLLEITYDFYRDFGIKERRIEDCLKCIRNFRNERRITSALSLIDLMKEEYCSASLLAKLAFSRYLDVSGKYRSFAPSDLYGPIEVVADMPIKLSSVMSSRFIFGEMLGGQQPKALAWYMGHLHIFARTQRMEWTPLTTVGAESKNGRPIVDYLYSHLNHFKIFRASIHNWAEGYKARRSNPPPGVEIWEIDDEEMENIRVLFSKFDFGRLPVMPVDGNIV
ncbi:BgTH12-02929 [Blumeria graminis f. sp. triticale]|uniref:BgTH12-02929 n=1 Tax=Blumeria graminis f. sp. triticale TaxID=1689686 RepID=A0A9W4D3M3_BLUGR|nr:BgTH12-02929 [Blumeria graminis f. sp. triticale]